MNMIKFHSLHLITTTIHGVNMIMRGFLLLVRQRTDLNTNFTPLSELYKNYSYKMMKSSKF